MTNDPNIDGVLSSIRALLVALGAWMATSGFEHTGAYADVMLASGGVMVVGPAVWGVWVAVQRALNGRKAMAVGVAAGINMTVQGKALDSNGAPISAFSAAADTPPKPVTVASAADIVAAFAPSQAPAAK